MHEYGLPSFCSHASKGGRSGSFNYIDFTPFEFGVSANYVNERLLVDELLSSTRIFLTTDMRTQRVSISG